MFKQEKDAMQNRADSKTEKIFLSYVSHRIRTPLNSVIGFSKLLLNRDMKEEKSKVFAERILDSGYELLFYFQNIMDLSEIEAGMITVNPVKFEIKQFFESLAAEYTDRIQNERKLNVYYNELVEDKHRLSLYTDEFMFKRILSNMIELARQYIVEGEIQISFVKTKGDEIKSYVRGIVDKNNQHSEMSYLTSNYPNGQQEDSIDYLTYKVTKQLSGLLKGEFTVENKDDRGILISFTIPWGHAV